jgi:hypothetical protein
VTWRLLDHCINDSPEPAANFEQNTMTKTNEASALHKQAASDHQAAAMHHNKAAECHDQNDVSDAKTNSIKAMECCNTAQKNSKTACDCSSK